MLEEMKGMRKDGWIEVRNKRVRFFFDVGPPGESACSNCERFRGTCCGTAVDPTSSSISSIGYEEKTCDIKSIGMPRVGNVTLFTLNGFPKTCCRTG